MTPLVASFLVAEGQVTADATWTPLQGGRSNSLWRIKAPGADWVCKLFHAPDSNPLFPNDSTAEAVVLAALKGVGLAPELIKTVSTPAGLCIFYDFIPGKAGRVSPEDVAGLLGRLHCLRRGPAVRRLPTEIDALLAHALRILDQCKQKSDLLALKPTVPDLTAVTPVLIHGDATAANIISTKTGCVLIDWQCPALADPCEDIATYLSPAMQFLSTGSPLSQPQIEEFLQAYPVVATTQRYRAIAPLFHFRMAAYCRWKTDAGHSEYSDAGALEVLALKELSRSTSQSQ
ncbi:MAG: aminoglycoside phosphotransferase family protein [Pseudoruegeria sp.]